jgi:hypothetical protein
MKKLVFLWCILLMLLPGIVLASCVRKYEGGIPEVSCLTDEEEFEFFVAIKDVIVSGKAVKVTNWHDEVPKMDEVRFAVDKGIKGAADGDTISFWVNLGMKESSELHSVVPGEECIAFLDRDLASGMLWMSLPYKDRFEIEDACIELLEQLVDKNRRYNIYDRSTLVVHGLVIGSTREPGGGRFHSHIHMHEHDHHEHAEAHGHAEGHEHAEEHGHAEGHEHAEEHGHAEGNKEHLREMLGEIPKVWPDCGHEPEGVLIDVKRTLKGAARDTVKIAIQRVYISAYPQFDEDQEVIVFLEPLERDFYQLVGGKRSKVLLFNGEVAGRETPQEFIERIEAKGD